ncbi:MAG TPA: DUF2062 domain-containing protein [Planctomycetota bacterium]|nr:DUF2062 domain-containing protein [Planctomycetota bacterium]
MTTPAEPKICVAVPACNDAATVAGLIDAVRRMADDVIVVDDVGSTDGSTGGTAALPAGIAGIDVITRERNRGKGAALLAAFERAASRGCTHAITIDAGGRHQAADIPKLVEAIRQHPDSIIVGVRDLHGAGARRRTGILRACSDFCVWVQTRHWIRDARSGFRAYPLGPVLSLALKAPQCGFEIESLVKAMWAGVPVRTVDVAARHSAASRSRCRPVRDRAMVCALNFRLLAMALLLPAPLLRVMFLREYAKQSRMQRAMYIVRHGLGTNSPGIFAASVGLGVLCGLLPIWGFQTALAFLAAHKLRLSKVTAFITSTVSFPLAIPLTLYVSVVVGQMVLTGHFDPAISLADLSVDSMWHKAAAYVIGSVIVAVMASLLATAGSYALAVFLLQEKRQNT